MTTPTRLAAAASWWVSRLWNRSTSLDRAMLAAAIAAFAWAAGVALPELDTMERRLEEPAPAAVPMPCDASAAGAAAARSLARARSVVAEADAHDVALVRLKALADNTGATLVGTAFQHGDLPANRWSSMTMTMNLTGSYPQIRNFLSSSSRLVPLAVAQRLELKRRQGTAALDAKIEVVHYASLDEPR